MTITLDKANMRIEDNKVILEISDREQLAALLSSDKKPLSSMNPGDRFKLGEDVFIVLEHTAEGTRVISEDFIYENMSFGENSNWLESPIRVKLAELFPKISAIVGKENIIPMFRDLTSMDGLDDYGSCSDVISMLTFDEYRKYHKILGLNPDYSDWWWTITPASTPSNDYSRYVCCVDSNGILLCNVCDYDGQIHIAK